MRGEIGRAIRLHQNLLLRRDLAPAQTPARARGSRRGLPPGRLPAARDRVVRGGARARPATRGALRALVTLLGDVREHRARARARAAARRAPARRRGAPPSEADLWVDMAERGAGRGPRRATRAARCKRALRATRVGARRGSLPGELEAERGRSKRALAAWRRVPAIDRRQRRARLPAPRGDLRGARPRARLRGLPARACCETAGDDPHARLALARALAARGEMRGGARGAAPRCSSASPSTSERARRARRALLLAEHREATRCQGVRRAARRALETAAALPRPASGRARMSRLRASTRR